MPFRLTHPVTTGKGYLRWLPFASITPLSRHVSTAHGTPEVLPTFESVHSLLVIMQAAWHDLHLFLRFRPCSQYRFTVIDYPFHGGFADRTGFRCGEGACGTPFGAGREVEHHLPTALEMACIVLLILGRRCGYQYGGWIRTIRTLHAIQRAGFCCRTTWKWVSPLAWLYLLTTNLLQEGGYRMNGWSSSGQCLSVEGFRSQRT
jgi:hypothetical protein